MAAKSKPDDENNIMAQYLASRRMDLQPELCAYSLSMLTGCSLPTALLKLSAKPAIICMLLIAIANLVEFNEIRLE